MTDVLLHIHAKTARVAYDSKMLRDNLILTTYGGDQIEIDIDDDDFLSGLISILSTEASERDLRHLRNEVKSLKVRQEQALLAVNNRRKDLEAAHDRHIESTQSWLAAQNELKKLEGK